jgi:hypothetical protein
MFVFVDDSGDPGFKFGQGSSNFLVIACCVFESVEAVENASSLISKLAIELNSGHGFELKFNKSSHETRIRILSEIVNLNFFIRVMVVDKREVSNRKDFLLEMLAETLRESSEAIRAAKITIDGKKPAKISGEISRRLRTAVNRDSLTVHSVRFRNSKSDPLIQLADVVAGAIRKTYEDAGSSASPYLSFVAALGQKPNSRIWVLREK